jgi:MFS family permease
MMFFYCLAVAFVAPMFPDYLEKVTGSPVYVGIFIAISSVTTLIVSLLVSKILHRVSKILLLYIGFIGMAITFAFYYFFRSFEVVLLLQIFRGVATAVLFVVIPLMVRDYTAKKSLAHEEGVYYLLLNLAWIIGPLAGGIFSLYMGSSLMFWFAVAVFLIAVMFLRHEEITDINTKEKKRIKGVFASMKEYFSRWSLVKAYLIDFGLFVWWSITTMCVPLYIVQNGLPEIFSGIAFALQLLPLLFLEGWVGDHVKNSKMGTYIERGFLIMIMFIILMAVVDNVYFSLAMLFCSSIGAAFVEPIKETYLFKHMKENEEDDLFPVYSTARQLGYFVGPLLSGFIVAYFGYQALFFVAAVILLPMVFIGYLIHKES